MDKLAFQAAAADVESEPITASVSPFDKLTVLVVDHNAGALRSLVESLKLLGVQHVSTAGNGEEAIALMKRIAPDMVICEYQMPVMTGIELTRHLRTDPLSLARHIPILMTGSVCDEKRLFEARDAGINEFLLKPPSIKSLFEHLIIVVKGEREFVAAPSYNGPDRRRGRRRVYSGEERRAARRAAGPETETAGRIPDPATD
ncbi:MAG: response regulator [Alphaproteobacteria bacterium]